MTIKRRPKENECNAYYQLYISKVSGNDVIHAMKEELDELIAFLKSIPEGKWSFSYAPGKWTLLETFLHLIDTERIMAYRALRIARGDTTPLPGFNQDDYVPNSGANRRKPASIIAEFAAVRNASIQLFQHFDNSDFSRFGNASESPVTPLALAYIIVGHGIHHRQLARERYLK